MPLHRCPSGKLHLKSECNCTEGNYFYYYDGRWLTERPLEVNTGASLSWSGRLTGTDLFVAAIGTGIMLFVVITSVIGIVYLYETNRSPKIHEQKANKATLQYSLPEEG